LYVPTPEAANEMTTALQRWKISAPSERRAWLSQKEQKFAVAAEQYRMADPKPALPEEACRFKVIYDEAIDHMKKYLTLVPNAPNTRAAQDKIYAWEGARESMKP